MMPIWEIMMITVGSVLALMLLYPWLFRWYGQYVDWVMKEKR